MYTAERLAGGFRMPGGSATRATGMLRKCFTILVAAVVFGLALMFSVVLLAAVVAIGSIAVGRLWWKSRGLNSRDRDNPSRGLVLEGEVIREVPEHDERSH
jgi:hypothetical protein